MNCGAANCGEQLAKLDQFIFYMRSDRDVQLTLAPETSEFVTQNNLLIGEEKGGKKEVYCKFCNSSVGKEIKFGPGGTAIISFGKEKVEVLGVRFSKQERWPEIVRMEKLGPVAKRSQEDFFQDKRTSKNSDRLFNCPDLPPVRFLEPDEIESSILSDWHELLLKKTPKDFQLKCYIEAVQRDLVTVIPTGAGKTLIASMLLHKMRLLNRNRMGLFIVDRIPLVFQQQKAISKETGLRVIGMAGQNKTWTMVNGLHSDEYDVMVATAGLVDSMLQNKWIYLDMFSCIVFDEAHHCQGRHIYRTVLDKIFLMEASKKPRILGLTASPVKANTIEKARNGLEKLREAFKMETFYRPETGESSAAKPEYISYINTDLQKEFRSDAIQANNKLVEEINKTVPDAELKLSCSTELEYGRIKGEIRAVSSINDGDATRKRMLDIMEILLDTEEIVSSMGVLFGSEILAEHEEKMETYFPVDKYKESKELSPKLDILKQQIESYTENDTSLNEEDVKSVEAMENSYGILVFVETRECARRLKRYLQEIYPDLKPELVVGHGGVDGQSWDGNQSKIIDRFHGGECKLLVSTSVLEEGIDVSRCKLVVRYSGVQTLIQFIQSRGRARSKEGSKFVVICNQSDVSAAEQMDQQEDIMNYVLKEHASRYNVFSLKSKEIFDAIIKGEKIIFSAKQSFSRIPEKYQQTTAVVELFICTEELVDEDAIQDEFSEKLDVYGLDMSRFILNVKGNVAHQSCDQMFGPNDIQVLIEMTDGDFDGMSYQTLHNFFSKWSFKAIDHLPVFGKVNVKEDGMPDEKSLNWTLPSIGVGSFLNKQTFNECYVLDKPVELNFSATGMKIRLTFEELELKYVLELSLLKTSCLGFALSTFQERKGNIFLPLENMPNLHSYDTSARNKKRVTFHKLLTNLAKFRVLRIDFDLNGIEDWLLLQEIFNSSYIFPWPVYESRIKIVKMDVEDKVQCNIDIPADFEHRKEMLEDEWEVLAKSSDMVIRSNFSEVNGWIERIRQAYLDSDVIKAQKIATAIRLANRDGETYWTSFDKIVQDELSMIDNIKELEDFGKIAISEFQTRVLRLVVTPSRLVFLPDIPMTNCRLTRMLSTTRRIIIVAFRDENLDKAENDDNIHERIVKCITEGIDFCGRKLYFLLASQSQLRDHKAFYLEGSSNEEMDVIRQKIIPSPEIFKSSSKYLSRLGLFGTSDRHAGEIPFENFQMINDLYAKNNAIETDGSGFVKESLALKLAATAKLDSKVNSAIQFRYRGLKGVLVVLPDNHAVFNGKSAPILYRESQMKFSTEHNEFGIVKIAKAYPVHLNRESITLLDSLYLYYDSSSRSWNLPKILKEYQENFLSEQAELLEKVGNAHEVLKEYVPQDIIDKVKASGFDLLLEPFFFRLLRCIHKITISDLCKRTNLLVKDGCMAMGIPDYTGKLKTDQIFLQIRKNDEVLVIKGKVVIYRNPCLHPGDVRLVEAVDIPELHYSEDVLVLPAGNSDYSLSASCSGGDLDGDQFSVIWDQNLIPPKEWIQEPLDYEDLGGTKPGDLSDATSLPRIADFYVRNMKNQALGRVAHMHLALSDIMPKGAMDPLCKKLAESQAVAVDFPKTGITPQVPEEALKMVQKEGFPDYMEKKGDTYPSKKILGELYRDSKSFLFTYDLEEQENRKIPFDKALAIPISEEIESKAANIYHCYIIEMKRLMNQFSLKQEEEVVLGRAIVWHSLLDSDRDKSSQYLKEAYRALRKKFKAKFRDLCPNNYEKEWAAAWYKVSYDQNIDYKKRPFLSFPWIAYEAICEIKERSFKIPEFTNKYIDEELGMSSLNALSSETTNDKFKLDLLKEKLKHKQNILSKIKELVDENCGANCFEISPYGSSSILLCEEDSDLDVMIRILPGAFDLNQHKEELLQLDETAQMRHFLKNYVTEVVDKIFVEKVDLIGNDVPLIKGTADCQTHVDITCNMSGLKKTYFILSLYQYDVAYFVAFWILVRWARFSGLIKFYSQDMDVPQMETAVFYALLIHILKPDRPEIEGHLNLPTDLKTKSMPELLDYFKEKLDDEKNKEDGFTIRVGELIHRFFREGRCLEKNDLTVAWPIDGVDAVHINQSTVAAVRKACGRGLHVLLFSRNVDELMIAAQDNTFTGTQLVKRLSLNLSNALRGCLEFHQKRLSVVTRAKVSLRLENGESRLLLVAEGPRIALMAVFNEITALTNNVKAFSIGLPKRMISRYFMEGCTIMSVQEVKEDNLKVGFVDCQGSYHPPHRSHQRSSITPKFSSGLKMEDWVKESILQLENKMLCQMASLSTMKDHIKKSLEVTSRFGVSYALDVEEKLPKTQTTMHLDELMSLAETGKLKRKTIERRDIPKKLKPDKKEEKTDFKMKELKPGKGRRTLDGAKEANFRFKKDQRYTSGLSLSYLPGVFNPENQSILEQKEKAKEIYVRTLEDLGYTEGCIDMKRISKDEYWSVNISSPSGFELQLILNSKFEYLDLKERNLTHVHATYFHGREIQPTMKDLFIPETDVRYIVQTAEPVFSSSNIFKWLFEEGSTDNLPVELNSASKPRIKPDLSKALESTVSVVKHSRDIKLMKKGDVQASIITGTIYSGEKLQEEREYCDISLYFLPEQLVQALIDTSQMKSFATLCMEETFKVSSLLEDKLRTFNEKMRNNEFPS